MHHSSQTRLMDLFPSSPAPTYYDKPSKLVLKKELDWMIRDSQWGPRGDEWRGLSVVDEETRKKQKGKLDESAVFHARLHHQSLVERKWNLGIGKGGHLYSIHSSFGEAVPPQMSEARWMDEAWQFTTIYPSIARMNELPDDRGHAFKHCGNAFVHQSGMYIKGDMEKKTFYTPMFGEYFNEEERSFSMLNWGLVPTPSINRSGVLIYVKYRDLGDGVIEMSYLVYNFENERMENLGPWGGVRHSVFPEQVVSNPDGSYRCFHPVSFFDGTGRINFVDTGGWIAATQNADNPYSYALGLVFGKEQPNCLGKYDASYACGYADDAMRDYMVQAVNYGPESKPRQPHLIRMYFVVGTLDRVAEKGNQLAGHAHYEILDFNEGNVPLTPLYEKVHGEDTVLSREGEGMPQCQVYAWPVKGSYPIFVIKSTKTGRHVVTADPYAHCAKEPFDNPFEPGHEYFNNFENQTVYHPYREESEWVELLGYVMPGDEADIHGYDYLALSEIPALKKSFFAGEKQRSELLLARSARCAC